ncbi:LuxR C-terminal-related transcriptional regulator [Aliarcobacter cibarius]|jgi:DNA-binding NarL/FixJ family response regulator|uniref:DNA-binding response regulator, NarL/FixJ family n=1 Tax=Aliarcobacter cibarius TaxID=255507 RepID=A0A7L5JPW2_9BACT|nr:LuxR C-terminal-related transcriptional regulator [Aliarcobacter cibarius]QKJ27294.1 DNA-binding response regulator, NarL/FixJ family [Aliarcobacter cibarius]TLT01490.1 helix-turn-helix transcriptional regulator [Aliarcobacter cibarius]TLT01981.1 helix-turn-helix transcriptional regulator [Aliarcobacter cibarius]TLT04177.1 helix-turn-helix transcriptional regulator [Aliarcobacter cibarius]
MIYIHDDGLTLLNKSIRLPKELKYKFFTNKNLIEVTDEDIVVFLNIELDSPMLNEIIDLNTSIIILDSNPSFEKGVKLLSLGVKAYANILINDIHLKDVINTVKAGNIWLYPEFINYLALNLNTNNKTINIDKEFEVLTQKEKEVAFLVLKKISYLDISKQLNISIRTVKAHTKSIYEKFNVINRLAFILKFS